MAVQLDWTPELWQPPIRPATPTMLASALVAGLVSAVALGEVFSGGLGVNIVISALAVALAVLPTAWSAGRVAVNGKVNRTGVLSAVLALGLVSVAAARDALWVAGPCLTLAAPLASYALTGGGSWTEVLGGGLALPFAGSRMFPWLRSGLRETVRSGHWRTVARSALVAACLLAVFGALFAGADAAFHDLAARLVPAMPVGPSIWRIAVCAGGALLVLAAAFLVLAPPPLPVLVPAPGRPVGRWAWAAPLVALDALFLAFVAVQATVLLAADKDALLRSTGLTYAQYARQGFFQLAIATVLVLAVVAVAARHAPRATPADRALVRSLLGLLCALTLVVVAVALRRLFLYEEAFGWTRLRLWVHAFELWLGLVVVLVAAAGLRLRAAWLPRAVAASGAVALIGLAGLNPDGFIAERDVTRFTHSGTIDEPYLSGLSADAVPALDRLPEPQRSCALKRIEARLSHDAPWLSANLGRHRARAVLAARPTVVWARCFPADAG